MKKILFSDRFGLTDAVLTRQKTMTRRLAKVPDGFDNPVMGIDKRGRVYFTVEGNDGARLDIYPAYQIGEEVAVAQCYEDAILYVGEEEWHRQRKWYRIENLRKRAAFHNKMFVQSDLMPHRIKITDIKLERLNDISDEDCRKEGIIHVTWRQWLKQDIDDFSPQEYRDHDLWTLPMYEKTFTDAWADNDSEAWAAESPQMAFIVLMSKLARKHPQDINVRNPWNFAFEFELTR